MYWRQSLKYWEARCWVSSRQEQRCGHHSRADAFLGLSGQHGPHAPVASNPSFT